MGENNRPLYTPAQIATTTAVTAAALFLVWLFGPRPMGFEPVGDLTTPALLATNFGYAVAALWTPIVVGWVCIVVIGERMGESDQ